MFIISEKTRHLTKTLAFLFLLLPISLFAQQKHALFVGISDYPQYDIADASWAPIHGTNDVQLISPILAKQGFAINMLLNEAATHSAIVNGFEKLTREVQSGDIVYIHLSGHGQAVEDFYKELDANFDSYEPGQYSFSFSCYFNRLKIAFGAIGISVMAQRPAPYSSGWRLNIH